MESLIEKKEEQIPHLIEDELRAENRYLHIKIKILENISSNKGEKDENLTKAKVYYLNDANKIDELQKIFGIEASEGIKLLSMDSDKCITDINECISKAKSDCKADCKIKMNQSGKIYNSSIKSKNCANPAILNHTPRTAKVFQEAAVLHEYLNSIDLIAKEYNEKRKAKEIGEDVSIDKLEILKEDIIKKDFMNVLSYFMFEGSGKGDSIVKSNSIIEYKNGQVIFTKCCSKEEKLEYIKKIYDKVIISFRDKGMPRKIDDYNLPWVFNHEKNDGTIKYKGSLHIRLNNV
tara:strand:+ start:3193 stop:4065 length:873 start_codon:yes stop_codon:yes gene_type:complete